MAALWCAVTCNRCGPRRLYGGCGKRGIVRWLQQSQPAGAVTDRRTPKQTALYTLQGFFIYRAADFGVFDH